MSNGRLTTGNGFEAEYVVGLCYSYPCRHVRAQVVSKPQWPRRWQEGCMGAVQVRSSHLMRTVLLL